MGLREQDTYVIILAKEYEQRYSDIQIIPTMNVQTLKKDKVGALDRPSEESHRCPRQLRRPSMGEKREILRSRTPGRKFPNYDFDGRQ
jgi:hypothetical protein